MNTKRLNYFFLLIATLCGITAFSQEKDTTLQDQTIEVIQAYKPQVKQTPKPNFAPDLPPKETGTPSFQYDVPQQTLYYSYTPPALRPLVLAKDSTQLPYPNYVKLGGGNLATIYLDAGIGGIKGKNYNLAIHVHHLQQQGNLKYQKTALSGIEATGNLTTKKLYYTGSLHLLRNQYALYGDYFDTGSGAAPQNTYWGVAAALDAFNTTTNKANINYHPSVNLGFYGRKYITQTSFNLDLPASKKLNENFTVSAAFNLKIAATRSSFSTTVNNSNIVQFTPKIAYEKEGLKAHVAIAPTLGNGGSTYILPDVYLHYQIPSNHLSFFAGWLGTLQQNTFEQLTTINPYLAINYPTQQTRQMQVFGGFRASIGNALSFSAQVSHRDYKDFAMMVPGSYTSNIKEFSVLYDAQVKAISVEAAARYDVSNTFSIRLNGAYYDFYQKTYANVWQVPTLRFNIDFSLNVIKGLDITAYSRLLAGIYALDNMGLQTKLKPAFEAGAAAEYQIIPRLSAFLNVNNLFNNRYQRWYHYQVYGFNIYGGLRLKF